MRYDLDFLIAIVDVLRADYEYTNYEIYNWLCVTIGEDVKDVPTWQKYDLILWLMFGRPVMGLDRIKQGDGNSRGWKEHLDAWIDLGVRGRELDLDLPPTCEKG